MACWKLAVFRRQIVKRAANPGVSGDGAPGGPRRDTTPAVHIEPRSADCGQWAARSRDESTTIARVRSRVTFLTIRHAWTTGRGAGRRKAGRTESLSCQALEGASAKQLQGRVQ